MHIIKLLKKNKRKIKHNKNLVLAIVKKKNKFDKTNKVVEVIGSYDIFQKKLTFNIFRFIYWISLDISCSGSVLSILILFNIVRFYKNEFIIK